MTTLRKTIVLGIIALLLAYSRAQARPYSRGSAVVEQGHLRLPLVSPKNSQKHL